MGTVYTAVLTAEEVVQLAESIRELIPAAQWEDTGHGLRLNVTLHENDDGSFTAYVQ